MKTGKSINRKNKHAAAILSAAVLSVAALFAGTSQAQTQINAQGRANDANNRIGSGGTNSYHEAPSVGIMGNGIVTGTVSGGRQFRGSVGYSDSTTFRGLTGGTTMNNFIGDSAGIGLSNTPPPIPNSYGQFYGESRYSAPAAVGLSKAPNSAGYTPTKPETIEPGDQRLGARLDAQVNSTPGIGQLLLPGPVDPTSNTQTVLSASPLTGIRQLNTGDNSDANFLKRFSGAQQPSALDRLQLDARDLQSMRQQLKSGGALKDSGNKPLSVGGINGTPLGKPLNAPIDAPINGSLAAKPINGSVTVNPFGGNFNADVGTYNRVIGAPEEQSPVYNELKKRLEVYQQDRRTPTEKNAERFNQQLAAKNAAAKLASSGRKPGDIALPEANIKPGTVVQPMPVKTLSEGIAGKGLKDILAKAESLMKEGKYTSAIDQYSIGEQVAPNQPLIWIGRANAELGAAFYQRADIHLRQAFNSDKALLMAQYDLRTFFGADRLATVIKDLQDIASADQQSTTPVFLLAYISYNTANESRAAGYLDLAEKRSEGKDPIYRLLREHWTLPETEGAQKLPKPETKLPEIPKADGAPTIPENK